MRCRVRWLAAIAALSLTACQTPPVASIGGAESREAIALSAAERDHLRSGMRTYLQSTQEIVDAIATGKVDRAAKSAREAGMGAVKDVSLLSAAKLPPQFTLLGLDTHQRFDALADAAARAATRKELLERLGQVLANCSACHATYRVESH
ncbi:MAG: hypothetical protein AB1749_16770 [Pseudomonadota bacterium]